MECGPQFVLTEILYVLSCLSFKRLFNHVCLREETKELLFEASWVGIVDEELIFPVTSNYLSILVSMVFPDFVDLSDISSERTIEEIALILNEKFSNIL